jgi:hypothetical protein
VTRLSQEERKSLITRFYEKVAEGIPIDKQWMREKIEASAPRLPDDPTPEQVDAWVELADIIADPSFIESLRTNAKEVWTRNLDLERLQRLNTETADAARAARVAGASTESEQARALVERYLAGLAELAGKSAEDPVFRTGVRQRFERQDPRATRYWELVGILKGQASGASQAAEWRFVTQALMRVLASSG